jgi:hypothetical protein
MENTLRLRYEPNRFMLVFMFMFVTMVYEYKFKINDTTMNNVQNCDSYINEKKCLNTTTA